MKNNPTPDQLKEMVRENYSRIAGQSRATNAASCCGAGAGCATVDYGVMADDYKNLSGYHPDADLGLGCGLPTEFALIKKGDTVVDLGSGAGNDCFVARSVAGDEGKVIGIDFTDNMIDQARRNAAKLNFSNVEFIKGDIENIPLADNTADVVVSNCVLNLVPDKARAFAETFRILKPGGHFSVSDIVLEGELPEGLRQSAEMYAGCVAGAIRKDEYLGVIRDAGFTAITVQKEKVIQLPEALLADYISSEEAQNFAQASAGVVSITVYAEKPAV